MSRLNQILALIVITTVLAAMFGCGSNSNRGDITVTVTPSRIAMEAGGTHIFAALVGGTATQNITWETVPASPWDPTQVAEQPNGTIVSTPGVYVSYTIPVEGGEDLTITDYIGPGTYVAPDTTPYPGVARVMARSAENSGAEGYATIYVALTLGADGSVDLDSDTATANPTSDLIWNGDDDTIEPVNGARIVSMGDMGLAEFDETTRSELAALTYGVAPVDASVLGTVIAVRTNDDRYARVQVFGAFKLIMYTYD